MTQINLTPMNQTPMNQTPMNQTPRDDGNVPLILAFGSRWKSVF
ncbi:MULTISPECIES: hypothetical protein [Planktothricoides]|uniref:Uncharacterized protein n=1 Tax=Planktothricoides raciborskii GIHE-MW2 TaxID=2792601 RepID=A0AAU8JFS8_9CYAN|nr:MULTISPECIES: hypothetical protein [Planktothricoides]